MDITSSFIRRIADENGIDISEYDINQLIQGYKIELEHDTNDQPNIDVIKDESDPLKIAIHHLNELPDYYTRLNKMEQKGGLNKMSNFKGAKELVELANDLDDKGMTTEADALDSILTKVAAMHDEDNGPNKKTVNALNTLHKALKSFCGKNLDVRGQHRRKLTKILDACEDLIPDIEEIVGNSNSE